MAGNWFNGRNSMKLKVIVGGTLLVLLGSSVVWAGDPWKDKPWTEWTEKDVQRILNDSPWAKKLRRRLGRGQSLGSRGESLESVEWEEKGSTPAGPARGSVYVEPSAGIPEPSTTPRRVSHYHNVFVRWFSSVTVRQATMRQGQLGRPKSQSKVNKLPEYAIAVWGAVTAGFSNDELRQSAYLQPERSKQRIPATRVSDTEFGLLFYFPRDLNDKPVLETQEKKVEFYCCKVDSETYQKAIKVTFDLRKMVRDGKPDL
jgi:hypothetical protein